MILYKQFQKKESMKNLLLTVLALLITIPLFSQNLPIPTKWKIKKNGISLWVEMEYDLKY